MKNKKDNSSNVPNMRFPGFDVDWINKSLGEICKMQAGKFISASDIHEFHDGSFYPCYGGNGLRGYTKNCNQDGIFSLIGRQGALCGNVTLAKGKFHATEHAVVVYPNNNLDTIWGYYLLNYLNLNKYATGMAQPGLSVQNLEKVAVTIPKSKDEQRKIANLLQLIDERISTQNKIIEKLESLMQNFITKLLTQKLRFKDENDRKFQEWEEKRLDSFIVKFIVPMRDKPKNLNGEIPWCRIEDFNGKYLLSSKSGQGVSKQTIENMNLKVYPINTLLVSCSANLGFCAIVKRELITNQTFIGLVPNESKINIEYLYYVMKLSAKKLNTLSSGTTISYLSREQFEQFKVKIPSLMEQTKISQNLSAIDNRINTETMILDKYQNQKKYLLQNLFI